QRHIVAIAARPRGRRTLPEPRPPILDRLVAFRRLVGRRPDIAAWREGGRLAGAAIFQVVHEPLLEPQLEVLRVLVPGGGREELLPRGPGQFFIPRLFRAVSAG